MKEKYTETISKPIDKSNRGFKLLEKLGFKQGESLGKSNKGIIDPLQPTIKINKKGIGNEEFNENNESNKVINYLL